MIITKPTRTDANGRKLYPFNMARYGHNIELAYNHQWLICREMEDGERDWDKAAFAHLERLENAYTAAIGNGIAWVDGKTYGVLKEASLWADCYRDRRNS